jgi:HK97 family phage prohead protease
VDFKGLADLTWRSDAPAGSLQATFSRFGVVDRDGDLTLPSAFQDGQRVPMVWAHQWTEPVGDGTIRVLSDRAVFEGQFWTDTIDGEQAYKKVKRAGDLQEYSYGFQIRDAGPGTHDGQPVRVLKSLEVFEVSPVLVGAGIGTGTDRIKAAELEIDLEEKPFANEHACRLADPGRFDRFRRVNNDRQHDGKQIDVIYGHPRSGGGWEQQALRLPTSSWDADAARSYCASHEGTFEAAKSHDQVLMADLVAELALVKVGRRFSAASRAEIQAAIDALAALIREVTADEEDPKQLVPAGLTLGWVEEFRTRYRLGGS